MDETSIRIHLLAAPLIWARPGRSGDMGGDFQVCLAQARFDETVKEASEEFLPGAARVRIRVGAGWTRLGRPMLCLPQGDRLRCYEGRHPRAPLVDHRLNL
jgi:hypothetical protein